MYRSASCLKDFYARACAAAEVITDDYEVILVNDGSPDDSLDIARSLFEQDPRVRIVDLSRNFGHHRAIMTGLEHARGTVVFLIDCDLEEEPESLTDLYKMLHEKDVDVVYGAPGRRKGGFFERFSGWLFWQLSNFLTTEPIPQDQTTMRLMRHRYVHALLKHQEREIFLPGLWEIAGFKQVPCRVPKHAREGTSYTLHRRVAQAVDSITSFSNKPLVLIFYIGAFIMSISSISAIRLIVRKLMSAELPLGWPTLIVSVWFIGGLIIFCVGIVGIYLSKVFLEVKQRPRTLVRRTYTHFSESHVDPNNNASTLAPTPVDERLSRI